VIGQFVKYGKMLESTVAAQVPVVVGTAHVMLVLLPRARPWVGPGAQEPLGQVQVLLKFTVEVNMYSLVPGGLV
jgi:hypothetical protein